jgi:hypothetical protein
MALGLFYLYNVGYNHWLYNPMMYGLWTYADLIKPETILPIIVRRIVVLATAVFALVMTHSLFGRKTNPSLSSLTSHG